MIGQNHKVGSLTGEALVEQLRHEQAKAIADWIDQRVLDFLLSTAGVNGSTAGS